MADSSMDIWILFEFKFIYSIQAFATRAIQL